MTYGFIHTPPPPPPPQSSSPPPPPLKNNDAEGQDWRLLIIIPNVSSSLRLALPEPATLDNYKLH